MPTTYSPSLRLAILGNGEDVGTWGTLTNTNLGTLLEQAITGVQTITMVNADYTLTNADGALNEARNAVLTIVGTNGAVRDLIAPLNEKLYIIANNTVGGFAIRIRAATGAAITIANGATVCVYCNGTDFVQGLNNSQIAAGANITVTTVGDVSTIAAAAVPAPVIPAGSIVAFYNAVAPTGWVNVNPGGSNYLMVMTNSGGTVSGSMDPVNMTVVPPHTHGVSGTTGTENQAHNHTDYGHAHSATTVIGGANTIQGWFSGGSYQSVGTGTGAAAANISNENQAHNHNFAVTSASNTGAAYWTPRYSNWMMCQKS